MIACIPQIKMFIACCTTASTYVGQNNETVHFIDWEHPEENDFAIAKVMSRNVCNLVVNSNNIKQQLSTNS